MDIAGHGDLRSRQSTTSGPISGGDQRGPQSERLGVAQSTPELRQIGGPKRVGGLTNHTR